MQFTGADVPRQGIGAPSTTPIGSSARFGRVLPADASWLHLGGYAFIFPVTLSGITLWLLWKRRQRIKEWPAVQTAADFSPATQILLLALFVVGLLMLVGLWAIDVGAMDFRLGSLNLGHVHWLQAAWWHNHAYIPNILAGATGFCIGAPVALVILASFTSQREDKATLDRVNRLSAQAWDSFRRLVNDFVTDERYELVVNQARDIKKYYDETSTAIDDLIVSANMGLIDPKLLERPVREISELVQQMSDIEKNFRTAVNALRLNINFFETRDQWAQIIGAWRVLDQYVRLQRLEQGLEWFDQRADAGFRKWTDQDGNPLQDLLDAIEIRLYTPNMTLNVDTMANALDTLSAYNRTDPMQLGQQLRIPGNPFHPDHSRSYHAKRDAAQLFILDLKRYIGLVELMYWPRGQTVPKRESNSYELTPNEVFGSLQTPEGKRQLEQAVSRIEARQKRERRKRCIKRALWGVSVSDHEATLREEQLTRVHRR